MIKFVEVVSEEELSKRNYPESISIKFKKYPEDDIEVFLISSTKKFENHGELGNFLMSLGEYLA